MVVMDQLAVMFVIAVHVGGRMEIIHKNVSNVSFHFEFQMIFKHKWKGLITSEMELDYYYQKLHAYELSNDLSLRIRKSGNFRKISKVRVDIA